MNVFSEVEQAAKLVGALIVLGGPLAGAVRVYRRTVGYRRDLASKVERLTGGVRYSYVEEVLGSSKFRDKVGNIVMDTFAFDPCFVMTLTDHHTGAVLLVAITATHPKFRPHFWVGSPGSHPAFKVVLGKTRFADVPETPSGSVTLLGARRFDHTESYYVGNPGNYQTFLLSYNDAGTGPLGNLGALLDGEPCIGYGDLATSALAPEAGLTPGDAQRMQTFRGATAVNTFAVTQRLLDVGDLAGLPLGVDLDTVRVLPMSRRRTRFWLARLRVGQLRARFMRGEGGQPS